MPDEPGLIAEVVTFPTLDTARLVYADWLDDHGQPERAGLIRLEWPRPEVSVRRTAAVVRAERLPFVLPLAARMEAEGRLGLAEFARRELDVSGGVEVPNGTHENEVKWLYDALGASWRLWLPPSVTLLGRTADQEAHNEDHPVRVITIPSRGRKWWLIRPCLSVYFEFGLPACGVRRGGLAAGWPRANQLVTVGRLRKGQVTPR